MTRVFIFRMRDGRRTEDVEQAIKWLAEADQLTPEYERQLRTDYAAAQEAHVMDTKLDTLADCAGEILAVAKFLSDTVYDDQKGSKGGSGIMPEPITRLGVVAGALAHIDSTRPRSRP